MRRWVFIFLAVGVLLLVSLAGLFWTPEYDDAVYLHPPPNASDLRFHFEETPLLHRLLFARLQYFNCIDPDHQIEFALAMGVGNHRDWIFPGRAMVFAKIYYPDGKFEYRVSDYPGQNFSGAAADSTSKVVDGQGEVMGEILQLAEDGGRARGV